MAAPPPQISKSLAAISYFHRIICIREKKPKQQFFFFNWRKKKELKRSDLGGS